MFSNGINGRLAVAAVSALAVTGVSAMSGSASATPGSAQVPTTTGVALAVPAGTQASTKNDGTDSTVRLEAVGGSAIASVRFEFSLNGGTTWNPIQTVSSRNDDGFFANDWAPATLGGVTLQLRAVGIDSSAAEYPSAPGTVTITGAVDAVNVTAGSAQGVFQQPYLGAHGQLVVIDGTSSAPGTIGTAFWDPSAAAFSDTGTTTSTATATAASWQKVIDITGYDYGTTDDLLIRASAGQDQDAEGFALYKQAITAVAAVPAATTIPSSQPTNPVVITVTDQSGKPVAGARVFRDGDVFPIGFTDGKGQVTTNQTHGTEAYYADATNAPGYDPSLGDKESAPVTVTQYNAVPTTLAATSNDGAAFDTEEYSTGDITVQVKDQKGANFDVPAAQPQTLTYHWVITPFAGGPDVVTADQTTSSEVVGLYTVNLPSGQPDGSYKLVAGLGANGLGNGAIASSTVLTVARGDSTLAFTASDPIQSGIGTDATVAGTLTLADGTSLPGRSVTVHDAAGGNSGILQADGTTVAASRTVTTAANGGFSVVVRDPASPGTGENDTIDAATVNGTSDGDDPQESAHTHVQFMASVTPTSVTVTDQGTHATDRPGEFQTFRVHVNNASGNASNQSVTVTVDHGFFTDGSPASAPVVGGAAGVLKNLGTSLPVTTDGNGNADVRVDIQRDPGFDDDGHVDATISATAGPKTGAAVEHWTTASGSPLNGASVTVSRAATAHQTVSVLPKAPTNESVSYDVFAKDQFGNLVAADVTVADDLANAFVNGQDSSSPVTSQFTTGNPAVVLDSGVAGNQTPTATWIAPTTSYVAPLPNTVTGTTTLTGAGAAVNWYVINLSGSHYALTHDTANTVPVGASVVETYTAIDQFGEPIQGVDVGFLRSGPDIYQDGSFNSGGTTNAMGQVKYVFAGAAPGTAIVQGIITDSQGVDGQPGAIVNASRARDQVGFGPVAKTAIDAKLTGTTHPGTDVIKVSAPAAAAGARVTLFKRVDGKLVRIGRTVLSSAGHGTFRVKDKNGDTIINYVVKVHATARTLADTAKVRVK